MSLVDPYLSDEELGDGLLEPKRLRGEPRSYSVSRKYEKQRPRRTRVPSRDTGKEPLIEALIVDSGAYSIKVNYSFEDKPKVIPNCIMKAKSERKRLFIGNQIDECRDCSGLFYLIPSERGYITKWDVQKPIWDYTFSKSVCPINSYPVIVTQPLFNFKSIQDCIDEIFFEEYEVSSLFRTNPTDLACLKYQQVVGSNTPCIIVDSGYSFTHVIPYLEGKKYLPGIKRINVGGKLLTNHLKDIISYRQYHVMEETFVINQVKEDTCFVSEDFKGDIKTAMSSGGKNSIVRNYVLPDFNTIRRGYIQDPGRKDEIPENCQILRLNNERFTVPEILFHPSDIAIKSIGIAEAVFGSIMSCPEFYRRKLANNIVCVGGSTKFPGFRDRLFTEVRSMMPGCWEVNVFQPPDPIGYSWDGGKALLKTPNFKSKLVTKEQYEELGLSAIQERFNDWSMGNIKEDDKKAKQEVTVQPVSYIDHVKKYDVFGKGGVVEEASGAASIEGGGGSSTGGNGDPSSKSAEEAGNGATKKDAEEASSSTDKPGDNNNSRNNNNKAAKKGVRNSTGLVYSVKIVSTTHNKST